MYLEFWGLEEKPFENTPNPRFLYPSDQHSEGLRKLLYAIGEAKGCALLTGEYGCGKTHLIRTVVSNLDPAHYQVALINYPIFDGKEFLQEILYEFGEGVEQISHAGGFRKLGELFYRNESVHKSSILVIDEAQIIDDPQVYEELRLLLNMQLEDRFLLTLLLIGQPELREQIKEYPQLDQRIAIKFHLKEFGRRDTANYVAHRLKVAGCTRKIFSDAALYLVYKVSNGVPRRINSLCDLCLFEGASKSVNTIDEEIIRCVL